MFAASAAPAKVRLTSSWPSATAPAAACQASPDLRSSCSSSVSAFAGAVCDRNNAVASAPLHRSRTTFGGSLFALHATFRGRRLSWREAERLPVPPGVVMASEEHQDAPEPDPRKERLERSLSSLRGPAAAPGRLHASLVRAVDAAAEAVCRATGVDPPEERRRALRSVLLLVGVPATVIAASQVLPTPAVVALDIGVLAMNMLWWLDLSAIQVAQKRIEADVDALLREQAEVDREQELLVAIAASKHAELEELREETQRVAAAQAGMSPGEALFRRSRLLVRAREVQEDVATAYAAEAHVMNRMAELSKEADGIAIRSEELKKRADAVLAPEWIAPEPWQPWSRPR
eukprot:tig00001098_g7067.t1